MLGVFVADDAVLQPSGAPRRAFLAGCLAELSDSLGGRLLVVHGRPDTVIPRLATAIGARAVHASADYGPYGARRDERVAEALRAKDIEFVTTGSPYAVAPGRVRKPDGTRYAVFTPYFRGWMNHGWRAPAGDGTRAEDQLDGSGGRRRPGSARSGRARAHGAGVDAAPRARRAGGACGPGRNSSTARSTATTTTGIGRIMLAPAGCRPI